MANSVLFILFFLHLGLDGIHFGGSFLLSLLTLLLSPLIFLSVFNLTLLLHGLLVGDRVGRVVFQSDFVVSLLTAVQEHSARTKNDSVVGLEVDRARRSHFHTIDVDVLGSFFAVGHQLCLVARCLELSVLALYTDSTQADLGIVLLIVLLAANFGIAVLLQIEEDLAVEHTILVKVKDLGVSTALGLLNFSFLLLFLLFFVALLGKLLFP